jgi:1-acyl-sn-glycerol-3-phosphate acyltransferase
MTKKVARWVLPVFYQIETEEETALGHQGPMVILPKHQYWTDIPIISLAFEPLLYFVAKQELFKFPVVRDYLLSLGGLPVDRKQSIRSLDSFKSLVGLLKSGEKIVIFPEGTYFRNEVGSGKSRLLQMILKLQPELGCAIPFVPVGIRYEKRSGWRRRITVRVGPPLFAKGESDAIPLTHRAMDEISRLCQLPLCQ